MFSNWHILGVAAVIVLSVCLADRWSARRRANLLRRLARESRVRYSPVDRFNIASRLPAALPDPAAANVRVRDLMYHTTADGHDYVFTVVYTLGSISGTRSRSLVVATHEPHGRSCNRFSHLRVADASHQSMREQYHSLLGATNE